MAEKNSLMPTAYHLYRDASNLMNGVENKASMVSRQTGRQILREAVGNTEATQAATSAKRNIRPAVEMLCAVGIQCSIIEARKDIKLFVDKNADSILETLLDKDIITDKQKDIKLLIKRQEELGNFTKDQILKTGHIDAKSGLVVDATTSQSKHITEVIDQTLYARLGIYNGNPVKNPVKKTVFSKANEKQLMNIIKTGKADFIHGCTEKISVKDAELMILDMKRKIYDKKRVSLRHFRPGMILRSSTNMLTRCVSSADTIKGYHIMQSMIMPASLTYKITIKPLLVKMSEHSKVLNAVLQPSQTLYKKILEPKVLKEAEKFTNKQLEGFTNWTGLDAKNMPSNIRTTSKTVTKTVRMKVKEKINQTTYKASKKIFGEKIAFSLVARRARKEARNKAILEVLVRVFSSIAKFFVGVKKYVIAAAVGVVILVFAAEAILGALSIVETVLCGVVSVKDDKDIDKIPDVTWMVKHLKKDHKKLEKQIKNLCKGYDSYEVVYTNGKEENYKEMITMATVFTGNEFDNFKKKEIYDYLDSVYDESHSMNYILTKYTVYISTPDGTVAVERTKITVYLNVIRGDNLCYSYLNSDYDGSMEYTNGSWLDCVQKVKKAYAEQHPNYSQKDYIHININDKTYRVRTDCSGMVSACLNVYGSTSETMGSDYMCGLNSLKGFTKYAWSGWNTLETGDIIVRHGHVEMFAANKNGTHYVWSAGSTNSLGSAGPTVSGQSEYEYVFRPKSNPGSSVDDGDHDKQDNKEGKEEAKNESGAITSLVSDANKCVNAGYSYSTSKHTISANGGSGNSFDFIKYIYAKHGVNTGKEIDDITALMLKVKRDALKKGDIVIVDSGQVPDKDEVVKQYLKDFYWNYDDLSKTAKKKAKTEASKAYKEKYQNEESYIYGVYVGSGNMVALIKKNSYGVGNGKGVVSLSLDSYKGKHLIGCYRPTGFTVNPYYGYESRFIGWTPDNIDYFNMLILMPEFWDVTSENCYIGYKEDEFNVYLYDNGYSDAEDDEDDEDSSGGINNPIKNPPGQELK